MKPVVLVVCISVCVLMGVIWVSKGTLLVTPPRTTKPPPEAPPLADPNGPLPKAVVENISYDFGVMLIRATKKHTFTIRNDGKGPLVLKKGKIPCGCMSSEFIEAKLKPGESADIEVSWKPDLLDDTFEKTVPIWTNDSRKQFINFVIKGRVDAIVVVEPTPGWLLGEIPEDEPVKVEGQVYSLILDEFKILDINCSNKKVTVTPRPMKPEELKEKKAKSGYVIDVEIATDVDVGRFRAALTIETDAHEESKFVLILDGNRRGPIQFLKGAGARAFHDVTRVLELERFDASEGKKAKLSLIVSGLGERELEFTDLKCDPSFLKVTLTADPNLSTPTRKLYVLTVEVPPGEVPTSRVSGSLATIQATINHPKQKHFKIGVMFISL